MAKPPSHSVYRSAVTGKFVKENYANSHPRTTVKETVPTRTPPKKK